MLLAMSNIDSSYSDCPILNPAALIKVLAIPPPTIIFCASLLIDFINSNLVDTFAPPITAIYGFS